MRALYIMLSSMLLTGCSGTIEETTSLPPSYGQAFEMGLIIPPEWSEDTLGTALKSALSENIPGLSKDIPRITVYERYEGMTVQSREHHLLFFVLNKEDTNTTSIQHRLLLKDEINQCSKHPCFFVTHDKWAKNQTIIGLIGDSPTSTLSYFQTHKDSIINICEHEVLAFYRRKMRQNNEFCCKESLLDRLSITSDGEWKIAVKKKNFAWIRKNGQETERSIFAIHLHHGSDEFPADTLFSDFRDSVIQKNIPHTLDLSALSTEKRMTPNIKRIKRNDIFVLEAKGLWKLNNSSEMGGPFISYLIPLPYNNGMIYIEGFLFAPGDQEAELLRKLEIILNTIELTTNG